ncbi:MAG: YceI family protein [Bdellovibrionales bacterium]|nr:YceI family protein [Bdellovibrionales bacterium]
MKVTTLTKTALGLTAAFSILGSMASASGLKYQPGDYAVDPMHSKIGFEVPHLVISTVEGRFLKFEGEVKLSESFEKSVVNASAETGSIDTGVKDRDDHLKSADFFDAAKHPQLKLKSTAIKGKPESFTLTADVTIKNTTKKVTFNGKYLGTAKDGYGNEKAAFTLSAKINRKDFGLTWNQAVEVGPVVGDQVTLELKVQAAKKVAPKTTPKVAHSNQ